MGNPYLRQTSTILTKEVVIALLYLLNQPKRMIINFMAGAKAAMMTLVVNMHDGVVGIVACGHVCNP